MKVNFISEIQNARYTRETVNHVNQIKSDLWAGYGFI